MYGYSLTTTHEEHIDSITTSNRGQNFDDTLGQHGSPDNTGPPGDDTALKSGDLDAETDTEAENRQEESKKESTELSGSTIPTDRYINRPYLNTKNNSDRQLSVIYVASPRE